MEKENRQTRHIAIFVRPGGIDTLTADGVAMTDASIKVDPSVVAISKILEEAVYLTPELLGDFTSTEIIADSRRFIIVPDSVADDSESLAAMAAMLWPDVAPEELTVDHTDRGCAIVSIIDPALTGFARRTFQNVVVHHRLAALVNFFAGLSRPVNKVKLYARLAADRVDIVALTADGLLMANSFDCHDDADAFYFIMACVKDCGFDALDDELLLTGDAEMCERLTPTLRKYVNSVMPLLLPTDVGRRRLELNILQSCE